MQILARSFSYYYKICYPYYIIYLYQQHNKIDIFTKKTKQKQKTNKKFKKKINVNNSKMFNWFNLFHSTEFIHSDKKKLIKTKYM